MNGRNWLILTALAMEAKAIETEFARSPVLEGIKPHVIGIQAVRLDLTLFKNVDGIILAGLGGGLNTNLFVGDVVIESLKFMHFFSPGMPGERQTEFLLSTRVGRIHTSDHLITEVAEKQKLFRDTGCAAVDMEGGIVRKIAESTGIPMLHLRAISDSADEALPNGIANWVDEVGEPKMTKVAAEVAIRPFLIPSLMRLQKNSRLALERMAQVVREVIFYLSLKNE